jgi:hypothetical protein
MCSVITGAIQINTKDKNSFFLKIFLSLVYISNMYRRKRLLSTGTIFEKKTSKVLYDAHKQRFEPSICFSKDLNNASFVSFKYPKNETACEFSKDPNSFIWITEIPEICKDSSFEFVQTIKTFIKKQLDCNIPEDIATSLVKLENECRQKFSSNNSSPSELGKKIHHSFISDNAENGVSSTDAFSCNNASETLTCDAFDDIIPLPESLERYIQSLPGDPQLALFLQMLRKRIQAAQKKYIEENVLSLVNQSNFHGYKTLPTKPSQKPVSSNISELLSFI